MSIATVYRIHRTGRPNVPALPSAAYNVIEMASLSGVFAGGAASTGGVAQTIGWIEMRDSGANTVTVSDG